MKLKDRKIGVVLHTQISVMLSAYTSFTWNRLSFLAAQSQGKSISHAQHIHTWLHCFLSLGKLPTLNILISTLPYLMMGIFLSELKLFLLKKSKTDYIFAKNIVNFVRSPEVQVKISKNSRPALISLCTAQHWLRKLDWQYGKKQKGMLKKKRVFQEGNEVL